ncbi:MAG: MMPL family transporter [Alphaproteobacteria bacterium]|nr:MMPL family transporter [Alphaproteobacteria bacterium]
MADPHPPAPEPSPGRGAHNLYGRVALWILDHSRAVVAVTAVLTLLSVVGALRLSVQPNVLDLLPDDEPTTQAIRKLNDEEGGTGLLSIAVTGGADDDARRAWTRSLAHDLEQLDDVDWVLYELPPDDAKRLGMLQLTPEELATIEGKVRSALAMGPAAQNPIVASRLLALGPLTARLTATEGVQVLSGKDGTERILVRPAFSAFDMKRSRPFMAQVDEVLAAHDPDGSGVRIAWIGGPYRHSVEDLESIVHDLTATLAFSVLLVLLFLALGFRSLRAVALILGPLVIGNVWTLGFAGVSVGQLNTYTSYFTAVLVGLGVDFGIHLYARYREERTHAPSAREAVARAWDHAGPPCATAAITSAAGFLALWVAHFQGFNQLGTLLGAGVMLCLIAELLLLPLLLVRLDDRVALHAKPPPPSQVDRHRYPLAPIVLGAGLLVAALAGTTLDRIPFEYDISELRGEGKAYQDLTDEQRGLAEASYTPIVVSFDDDAELAAAHARIVEGKASGDLPWVGSVLSLSTALPPDQADRVERLQRLAALAGEPGMAWLPPPVRQNLQALADAGPAVLGRDDLPAAVRQLIGANDDHHRLLIVPAGNMWDVREMTVLKGEVEQAFPDRVAAGEYLATALLFDLMQTDAPRVALLALILVFAASLVDLKSPTRAISAVVALSAGLALAGAGMVLTDLPLSMANFVGIPILMGIGVDVVIHLLHRVEEEGPGGILRALRTTGVAAGMSALTTIISFASLTMAESKGVQGLGMIIVLGLALVVGTAFVLVPAGWGSLWHLRARRDD